MKYRIFTQSGKYYDIDEQGRIGRLDMAFAPSGNWLCVGFREVLPFGNLGPIITPAQLQERSHYGQTRFKNGKGRYILEDIDHGTRRQWGDRITAIWAV